MSHTMYQVLASKKLLAPLWTVECKLVFPHYWELQFLSGPAYKCCGKAWYCACPCNPSTGDRWIPGSGQSESPACFRPAETLSPKARVVDTWGMIPNVVLWFWHEHMCKYTHMNIHTHKQNIIVYNQNAILKSIFCRMHITFALLGAESLHPDDHLYPIKE
jgi:hypothetical protein